MFTNGENESIDWKVEIKVACKPESALRMSPAGQVSCPSRAGVEPECLGPGPKFEARAVL